MTPEPVKGATAMLTISADDPLATAAVTAIRTGDLPTLRQLLADHPDLVNTRILDSRNKDPERARTLLHVATDWPGHFPNGPATVTALVEAGADVNPRFEGPHQETPLHWAASSDDVAILDALLDAGADIDAPGAVIGGGTPLSDATAFAQWNAAFRLVERGATTTLFTAASLGLQVRVTTYFTPNRPSQDEIDAAFWAACHGGRLPTAQYLADQGANINWIASWEPATPLDAAKRNHADDVVRWLHDHGAHQAGDLS
jgi:ankyrin repeat protein